MSDAPEWLPFMQELIKFFRDHPSPPVNTEFQFGIKIVDPVKWRAALEADIKAGPVGPRGLMGALEAELSEFKSWTLKS